MYRVIHILYSFLYVCIWTSIRSEWKSTSGQGCFLSLPMHRKPSFLGGTNLLWCFFIEKDLECSTLCQAGIVYKKESIWLINSMLCEIFLENVVRAWGYEWEQVFLPLAYKWFIVSLLCLQWGHEGINASNFLVGAEGKGWYAKNILENWSGKSILGLTLGLTEPCKPARLRHKKRELLWCNSLILWWSAWYLKIALFITKYQAISCSVSESSDIQ